LVRKQKATIFTSVNCPYERKEEDKGMLCKARTFVLPMALPFLIFDVILLGVVAT
jgi:hypothetical protein